MTNEKLSNAEKKMDVLMILLNIFIYASGYYRVCLILSLNKPLFKILFKNKLN